MKCKKLEKLISIGILSFMIANVAVMTKVEARMLEDWEIGVYKESPEELKIQRRAAYLKAKKEADSLYIGEWINTNNNRLLSITPEYWGNAQYTYRGGGMDWENPNKRILYMELEGHKLTVYFDLSKPDEFTTYRPEFKITSHYIRKK